MLNWFSRTELLLGRDGMERLAAARVAVIGAGAVGGYAVEALVRSGVGAVDIYEDRKITDGNVRALVYAAKCDVGKCMADLAAQRAISINPDVKIKIFKQKAADDMSAYDHVIRLNDPSGTAPHDMAAQGLIAAGDVIKKIAKGNGRSKEEGK